MKVVSALAPLKIDAGNVARPVQPLRSTDVRVSIFSKRPAGSDVTVLGTTIEIRSIPENAPLPIVSRPVGRMSPTLSALQSVNNPLGRLVMSVSERSREDRFMQFANAPAPTEVTVDGTDSDTNGNPANAPAPIVVRLGGRLTVANTENPDR